MVSRETVGGGGGGEALMSKQLKATWTEKQRKMKINGRSKHLEGCLDQKGKAEL